MLTLTNLKSPKGANRNTKRIGRGQGSGQGQQAGKGHKGQKARKSGHVRTGFEGGGQPLYMRLPKKGFKNEPFKVVFAVVGLSQINEKFESGEVSREALVANGLLKGANKHLPIKILANGELSKKLTFVGVAKFSKTAQTAIEKVGGTIKLAE
jgi:large subunit ribosomal protein L15